MLNKGKTVFLCGFMGSGKSTVGKELAMKLGRDFVDLDEYIVRQEVMSISEIFELKGEDYFRKLESHALASLPCSVGVVATGGGTLLRDENSALARSLGSVVYIDTPFELCYARIKGDKRRPIAYNSTREQLLERYNQRSVIYRRNSDFCVDGSLSPIEIVQEILKN
ncbi:MAG: shikimate kinase [Ruminococcus sp.]|nr:shikimate kinase [Ruminococcus sp.]